MAYLLLIFVYAASTDAWLKYTLMTSDTLNVPFSFSSRKRKTEKSRKKSRSDMTYLKHLKLEGFQVGHGSDDVHIFGLQMYSKVDVEFLLLSSVPLRLISHQKISIGHFRMMESDSRSNLNFPLENER